MGGNEFRRLSEHHSNEPLLPHEVCVVPNGAGAGRGVVRADDPKPMRLSPLNRELDSLIQHDHARRVVAIDHCAQAGLLLHHRLFGLGIPAMGKKTCETEIKIDAHICMP